MSGFSAHWLSLREPLDALARSARLGAVVAEILGPGRARTTPLEVIDLGAGTGANLRYAAPLLGGSQEWLLVENDPLLCAAGPPSLIRGENYECRVSTLELDLATQLHRLPLRVGTLLTAAALLDLVSDQWLHALARHAAEAGCTVWFALIYDGRIGCEPAEPEDEDVRELVNLHQLTDKGFGAALGPAAGRMAEQIFRQHGYRLQCAPSDWHIGPEHTALQQLLVEGWWRAATEVAPARAAALRHWLSRRSAHIDAGRSVLRVGHMDLVGAP